MTREGRTCVFIPITNENTAGETDKGLGYLDKDRAMVIVMTAAGDTPKFNYSMPLNQVPEVLSLVNGA
jgi:hypothetical protein